MYGPRKQRWIGTQRFPEKQSKKSLYKEAYPVSGDTLVDIRGSWMTSSKSLARSAEGDQRPHVVSGSTYSRVISSWCHSP